MKIMRPGQAEDVGISIPDLYGKSLLVTCNSEKLNCSDLLDQAEFLVMRRRGEYTIFSRLCAVSS